MEALPADCDPILADLLAARTDEERQAAIAELLAQHALPVVDAILRPRLQRLATSTSFEDLRGDVIVRLLHRLQRLLADPEGSIRSFRDYAAVVAFHRLDDYVRSTQPARVALSNRLRYLLTKDPELTLWTPALTEPVVGLDRWRREERSAVALPADLGAHLVPGAASGRLAPRDLRRLVLQIILRAGGPVPFGAVVAVLAEGLGVSDGAHQPGPLGVMACDDPGPLARLETQEYLQKLWHEILALPPRQRVALLLNLRDGRGDSVVRLLPATGAASRAEIARALEFDAVLLEALWPELPLDDNRIAKLLGIDARQKVINLRKSARERLARRMARPE